MIEFELEVAPEFLQAVLPFVAKMVSERSGKYGGERFPPPETGDHELDKAWVEGLADEARNDRVSLAVFLKNPALACGVVEVAEKEVEDVLRGLTELRLLLRESELAELSDDLLEEGLRNVERLRPRSRLAYLAYLLLAEIQEGLIGKIS